MPPQTFAETIHFTGITPTNTWVQYAGRLSFNDQNPENGSDEVAVFVSDGNGGEMLVGATIVGNTMDNYYLVSVYGDDAQTAQKDGAVAGDALTFKVWHSQLSIERTLDSVQMTSETTSGLTLPDIPPLFGTTHGEQYGYLNLQVTLETSYAQRKKVAIPVNSTIGILSWMSILILISIYALRKRIV